MVRVGRGYTAETARIGATQGTDLRAQCAPSAAALDRADINRKAGPCVPRCCGRTRLGSPPFALGPLRLRRRSVEGPRHEWDQFLDDVFGVGRIAAAVGKRRD